MDNAVDGDISRFHHAHEFEHALGHRECNVKNNHGRDQKLAVSRLEPKAWLGFEKDSQEEAGYINHRQLVSELSFIEERGVETKAAQPDQSASL